MMYVSKSFAALAVACLALVGSAGRVAADQQVTVSRSLVIAGHPEAVRLGTQVLAQGGTAADALVTTSLAVGFAEPGNSGPGGKMVMLYYEAATKKVYSIVALDQSALKLDVEKVLANRPGKRGYDAVCTPGLVAGLEAAHKQWGSKPWKNLVEPVAKLADDGFVLSPMAAEMMGEFPVKEDAEAAKIFAPNGESFKAGDRYRNSDYAATMRTLAKEGPRSFYEGTIAKQLVEGFAKAGSPIEVEDLKTYKARVLEPLHGTAAGFEVYTSPPPLMGGSTVLAAMQCLEGTDWKSMQPRDAKYVDVVGRVMQQVYPQVAQAAGDAPNSRPMVDAILTPTSIDSMRERAAKADVKNPFATEGANARISMLSAPFSSPFEPSLDDGDLASTTHLLVIDAKGNIACVTQSLGNHFGAAVVAPGTGFLMNNSMNNFGFANKNNVNALAAGKWARSTMAPTIVMKDSKPVLAIGSPAGQRIPTAILQVMLDVLMFERPLDEAITSPRFHVRRPTGSREPANALDLENHDGKTPPAAEEQMKTLGWETTVRTDADFYFGAVNAAVIRPDGKIIGVADQRRTGDAGGQ